MNYTASLGDFFKSPKWGMNILFGGVCMLIPLIGQILLSGWNITQLWARRGHGPQDPSLSMQDPAQLPAFDFDNFVKYLRRGLWPFLVQLVAGLVLAFFITLLAIIVLIGGGSVVASIPDATAFLLPLFISGGILFYLVLIITIHIVMVPLSLKATLSQGFNEAFDFGFVKSFLPRVWKELIVAALFMFALGIALMIVSMAIAIPTFGLGIFAMYFLMPPVVFSWQHLMKQLYLLHLERGGIAVTPSPKLGDMPPALPAAQI